MVQERTERLKGIHLELFYDIMVYCETKLQLCENGSSQYDDTGKRHKFFSAIGFNVVGKLDEGVQKENVMAKIEELPENTIFIESGVNLITGCIKHIRNAFAHAHIMVTDGEYKMYDYDIKKNNVITMYGRTNKECAEKLKEELYTDFNMPINKEEREEEAEKTEDAVAKK